MIIYSITINIDNEVHEDFLRWMKNNYIPALIQSGLIVENKILKLLTELDNGGVTYSFQYYLNRMEDYKQLENEVIPPLKNSLFNLFQSRYVEFTTLLEII
jgi:hypothetical protein